MHVSTVLTTQSPNGTLIWRPSTSYLEPQRVSNLFRDRLDDSGQEMVLPLTMFHPWCEISHLTIITVVSKRQFWTDQKDLLVVNDDSTVVNHVLVHDWPDGFVSVCHESHVGVFTDMPMSQIIPMVSSPARIFASTSQECNTVSPVARPFRSFT